MQIFSYNHIHFFLCIFFFLQNSFISYTISFIFFFVLKILLFFFFYKFVNHFFWIFPIFPQILFSSFTLIWSFSVTFKLLSSNFAFFLLDLSFFFFSFLWLFLSYSSLLPSLLPLQFICLSVSVKCFFHFSLCTFYTNLPKMQEWMHKSHYLLSIFFPTFFKLDLL